jgi:hypothetical protein
LATSCSIVPRTAIIGGCVNGNKQVENSTTVASTATNPSIADSAAVTNGLSILASIAAAADPWGVNANDTVRMPAVLRMVKSRSVKPIVENILHAGLVNAQAAVLHEISMILPWPLHASSR